MAKKDDAPVVSKSKKPLTAAQQAQKDENIRQAQERLRKLQEKQALDNRLRRDPAFRAAHEAKIKADREAVQARLNEANQRRQAEAAAKIQEAGNRIFQREYQRTFVNAALTGEHKERLVSWLHEREPTFERVERFFKERPKFTAPTITATLEATLQQQLAVATLIAIAHSPQRFNELSQLLQAG